MNESRLDRAAWAQLCTALGNIPNERFDIGALMRSSSAHVIREPVFIVRYKDMSNRKRLIAELNDQSRRRSISKVIQEHTGLHLIVQPELLKVQDYFVQAIHDVMQENGISESSASTPYEVPPSASFREVTQYTDWYVAGRGDKEPPYRFNRYSRVLRQSLRSVQLTDTSAVVHLDVGSGPGVFSWAFLDWAREQGIDYSRIRLHGYDHCEQMLVLASHIRRKLRTVINDYPPLHLHNDIRALLSEMQPSSDSEVTYVVTFGHVLAGNHTPSDISEYISLLEHVFDLLKQPASMPVIFSDVTSTHDVRFQEGLASLRSALTRAGIRSQIRRVTTYNGDCCLLLSRKEA